jgi:hypothetical protein
MLREWGCRIVSFEPQALAHAALARRAAVDDQPVAAGFEPYLLLPAYFERKLARQRQVDGVFMLVIAPDAAA